MTSARSSPASRARGRRPRDPARTSRRRGGSDCRSRATRVTCCTSARKRGTIDGQIDALFMLTRRRCLIALAIITGVGRVPALLRPLQGRSLPSFPHRRAFRVRRRRPAAPEHVDGRGEPEVLHVRSAADASGQRRPQRLRMVQRSADAVGARRRHDLHAAGPQHLGAARHGDDPGGLFDRTPPRRTGGGTDCGRPARKRRPAPSRLAFLHGRRQHGVLLRRHVGGGGGDRRSRQAIAPTSSRAPRLAQRSPASTTRCFSCR